METEYQECDKCGCEYPVTMVLCPSCKYDTSEEPRRMRDYD